MRHSQLFFAFILFASMLCKAQPYDNDDKKLTFGLNIGKGQPLLDYGNASSGYLPISRLNGRDTNTVNGYAQLGFHYDFYVGYKLRKSLKLMLALNGDMNSYDVGAINEQYTSYFPPGKVSVYTGKEYHAMQYMAGPKFNLPISKYCSVEFKALAGLTTLNYPPTLTYFGVKDTVIYAYYNGKGFGYNAGIGLKYNLAREGILDEMDGKVDIALHVNLNYAGASLVFPGYVVVNSASTAVGVYNFPKHMELGIVQLTVGLSVELLPPKLKKNGAL